MSFLEIYDWVLILGSFFAFWWGAFSFLVGFTGIIFCIVLILMFVVCLFVRDLLVCLYRGRFFSRLGIVVEIRMGRRLFSWIFRFGGEEIDIVNK